MFDLRIFTVILDAAFDIETTKYRDLPTKESRDAIGNLKERKQGCLITTDYGKLEVHVQKLREGNATTLKAQFNSTMRNLSTGTLEEEIKIQLETWAFLHFTNYEKVKCEVEYTGKHRLMIREGVLWENDK